nr:ribonuclease E/G [Frigidibacter sp. ROC022]
MDWIDGREVAVLLRDGRLDDLLVELPDAPPAPGAIFRAIADRPLKGQGAMLMRLPDGKSAFLRDSVGLKPGQAALVQVTSYVEAEKAVPVTAKVLFKSRYVIVTPEAPGLNVSRRVKDDERRVELLDLAEAGMAGSGMGLILRSEAETGDDAAIAEDIALTRELAEKVVADADGDAPELLLDGPGPHLAGWRDWPAPDMLDEEPGSFARHGVADLLDGLRSDSVPLGGGAHAWIEPTRALVAVDVNTGADGSLAAGLKANLALARDLPRQLRLRGLGGQITLDLAPMPKKDRPAFEGHLRAAFKTDPVDTALAGWTPLGHYELQRKRERLQIPRDLIP